jgi:hypothetical protein
MSQLGQSLPKGAVHPMSAFPPIATVERTCEQVRFVPKSEVRQMSFLDPRRAKKKDRLAAVSPSLTDA